MKMSVLEASMCRQLMDANLELPSMRLISSLHRHGATSHAFSSSGHLDTCKLLSCVTSLVSEDLKEKELGVFFA